ncbi:acyltransferase domain-containing protein [Solirubrobacter ginsenosidimutans]|uniref:Acyltransferase domain-containing protein n=1 Tax=Solirubrobacter ginsenosidimutans TaxID=490573 RepID=A0A9X3S7W1_9ACTN|nr:acyltransferase domain-containing protein [Solirubrobacter ginsenosidimutans]MDA0166411.1 acyltransferase domain-containing protein [Solirubrobacter ginsenosidimutans]
MLIDPSPGAPAFVAGLGPSRPPAFIYSGMGAQWWGMGAELYASEPTFRAAIDHCDALWPGASLTRFFTGGLDATPMPHPADAQPAGLALQVALTELWRSRGVEPAAIVGHSFGEIAAAWAAGAISLEQALSIAYHRSRLEERVAGRGAMLAVAMSEAAAREVLPGGVTLAAVNGANAVTLAGTPAALDALAAQLEVPAKRLDVSVAYHSAEIDHLWLDFHAAVGHVGAVTPRIPLYSTVAGADVTRAGYWWRNLRETTRFDAALRRMAQDGFTVFAEIGPHPQLSALVLEAVPGSVAVSSMRRGRGQGETFTRALERVLAHAPSAAGLHRASYAAVLPS